MKSGFVSIVGRGNAGKSTLLNSLIKEKIAITSPVFGTTRNIIEGIYNDDESQIIFVDTPGIGRAKNKLGKHLNKEAIAYTKEVDLILFVVDVSEKFGMGDKFVLNTINKNEVPIVLVLNKIDKISSDKLLKKIDALKNMHSFSDIVPISALKSDNLDRLLTVIKKYLKDTVKYFNPEEYTTISSRFLASEIVREKILNLTFDEVPHGITCYTEEFLEKKEAIKILVNIIVERDSLKKIIIGKNGSMIKEIGIAAREELAKLFNKKIYLQTHVKTIKNWKDKEKYFHELGLKEK